MEKRDIPLRKSLMVLFLCVILCVNPMVSASAAENKPDDVMNATSICVQGRKTEPEIPEKTVMTARSVSVEEGTVGENAAKVTLNRDDKWWGTETQATMTLADAVTRISDRKSVVIDSPIKEGFENHTAPVFAVDLGWKTYNMATEDLMFYVELPATGRGSSLRVVQICADSWSKYPAPEGMKYKYLSEGGTTWIDGTISTDGNKEMNLPDGFKGYVRIAVNTAGNCTEYANKEIAMQDIMFYLGSFGGDCGSVRFGGIWFTSKDDGQEISVDGGDPVALTEPKETVMTARSVSVEEGAVGENAAKVTLNRDDKWWGTETQATMKLADAVTRISDRKSVVIDSPIKEGFENHTAPVFAVDLGWKTYNMATEDLMFYVELPATGRGSSLRLVQICADGWSKYPAPGGMKYKYLSEGGTTWIDGTISTDGNKEMSLPDGFKGYVRIAVNTAGNCAEYANKEIAMQDIMFYLGSFGGDCGSVRFGGVWFTSKDDSQEISVDGGESVALTEPKEDPLPQPEGISIDECRDWWGATKRSTIALGEKIAPIGESLSVVIGSPQEEGVYVNRSAQVIGIYPYQEIRVGQEDIMFYVELPSTRTGATAIRMCDFRDTQDDVWGNYTNAVAEYLAVDGNEWISVRTDNDANIVLPDGFQGYIKLHPEELSTWKEFTGVHKLDFFRFYLGAYGGSYGDAKIGGVWLVSKSNSLYAVVDGGERQPLTSYYADNENALARYKELVEGLTEKNLEAASVVDELTSLYNFLADEYKSKITREELDKVAEYAAAVEPYRPSFLGVSIRPQGASKQAMKLGWTLDEDYLARKGYTVISVGAVALDAGSYDGKSLINGETKGAKVLTGQRSPAGYYWASLEMSAAEYSQDVLFRCYAVFRNSVSDQEITVWCGEYTDQSGKSSNYLECSVMEAAEHFGVSLYAE